VARTRAWPGVDGADAEDPDVDMIVRWLERAAWLRLDLFVGLLLATVLGGAIGLEREASGKPAGLRTNILICVGAALITELSILFAQIDGGADPARVTAQIVTGIGFLGAGSIIQSRGNVHGLTTAATIWVVAAIGIAVGSGAYVEAIGTTALVLLVLIPLGKLEYALEHRRRSRTVRLVVDGGSKTVDELRTIMEGAGLLARVTSVSREADSTTLEVFVTVEGPEAAFDAVRSTLIDMDRVKGLRIE
jgi:putative Mg2+ transporter-C (MgtC) family protein